jgi:hypothetical protein
MGQRARKGKKFPGRVVTSIGVPVLTFEKISRIGQYEGRSQNEVIATLLLFGLGVYEALTHRLRGQLPIGAVSPSPLPERWVSDELIAHEIFDGEAGLWVRKARKWNEDESIALTAALRRMDRRLKKLEKLGEL